MENLFTALIPVSSPMHQKGSVSVSEEKGNIRLGWKET
jgi:hypothetical protein